MRMTVLLRALKAAALATLLVGAPAYADGPFGGSGQSTTVTLTAPTGLAVSGSGCSITCILNLTWSGTIPESSINHTFASGISAPTFTGSGSGLTSIPTTSLSGPVENAQLANYKVILNSVDCDLGSACTITASASSVTPGTTTITGGTSGYIEYNNFGVLGELATSGSGSVALTTSPVFTTPNLGTPSAVNLANGTNLPLSGIATIANATILGNGTGSSAAPEAVVLGAGFIIGSSTTAPTYPIVTSSANPTATGQCLLSTGTSLPALWGTCPGGGGSGIPSGGTIGQLLVNTSSGTASWSNTFLSSIVSQNSSPELTLNASGNGTNAKNFAMTEDGSGTLILAFQNDSYGGAQNILTVTRSGATPTALNILESTAIGSPGSTGATLAVNGVGAFGSSSNDTYLFAYDIDSSNAGIEAHDAANSVKKNVDIAAYGGNVGVGTSGPSTEFEVLTNTEYAGLAVANSSHWIAALTGQSAGNDNGALNLYYGGTLETYITASGSSFISGPLGIGTSSPAYQLDVNGAAQFAGTIMQDANPASAVAIDVSGQTAISISSGSNAALPVASGLVIITDQGFGDPGVYLVGGGNSFRISGTANWVSPTTTPTSGTYSIQWDGSSNYRIYNNRTSAGPFNVMFLKT